ncbi:hypothetical protein AVEN_95141-1 [Araneus ventricosus]|uniref:Uncharacterized protein n=1 Tax=Araneus ventricosus TaxID=182803 RepID=A0A4Y2K9Y2_ARAVE|nr:hypothetical protein AVEN_95141-1 [Araneus ventricosus]
MPSRSFSELNSQCKDNDPFISPNRPSKSIPFRLIDAKAGGIDDMNLRRSESFLCSAVTSVKESRTITPSKEPMLSSKELLERLPASLSFYHSYTRCRCYILGGVRPIFQVFLQGLEDSLTDTENDGPSQ